MIHKSQTITIAGLASGKPLTATLEVSFGFPRDEIKDPQAQRVLYLELQNAMQRIFESYITGVAIPGELPPPAWTSPPPAWVEAMRIQELEQSVLALRKQRDEALDSLNKTTQDRDHWRRARQNAIRACEMVNEELDRCKALLVEKNEAVNVVRAERLRRMLLAYAQRAETNPEYINKDGTLKEIPLDVFDGIDHQTMHSVLEEHRTTPLSVESVTEGVVHVLRSDDTSNQDAISEVNVDKEPPEHQHKDVMAGVAQDATEWSVEEVYVPPGFFTEPPPIPVLTPTVVPLATPGGHLSTVDHLDEAYRQITALQDAIVLGDVTVSGAVEREIKGIRKHLVHALDQRSLSKNSPK